ncbi:hypothetical protein Amn_pb01910 (plasmid) [Aminobacter sp. Y103A]|jgi:hypothetical protein|nr:hypothetical protein Amn_pb01910 [Aminobacter sp. SS-2016]
MTAIAPTTRIWFGDAAELLRTAALQDLCPHDHELSFEHPMAEPCVGRHPRIVFVHDNDEQLLDSTRPIGARSSWGIILNIVAFMMGGGFKLP